MNLLNFSICKKKVLDNPDSGTNGVFYGDEEFVLNTANSGNSSAYDANGNRLYDSNSNVWGIRYNTLNLPDAMQFYQGHQTNYTYSATGAKLEVVDKTAPAGVALPVTSLNTILSNPSVAMTTTTDYVGNMIYENGTLKRILTPVGYWQDGTYYYFLKDHLGSNRVVINSSGTVVESSGYYPSGMRFGESAVNGGSVQPYRHTGHEMQEMHGLNWIDNNARFRTVSDGGGLPTVDPLCEKYYSISPYAYCAGNPVNRFDPDGMDWIYSTNDKKYTWRDDINAKSKMPEGYQYVGAKDNDILTHMGVSNKYETKTDNNTGIGVVGGDNKGPVGEGIPGATSSDVKADIRIDTNVSSNKKNITDNNKSGKTFNGVTVTAYVSERSASSSDDLTSNSYGVLSVSQGRKEYTAGLFEPKGSYISEAGAAATTASIQIPASAITPTNYLKSATVTIGSPNASMIYSSPTTITFNLQTRTYFRPSNK